MGLCGTGEHYPGVVGICPPTGSIHTPGCRVPAISMRRLPCWSSSALAIDPLPNELFLIVVQELILLCYPSNDYVYYESWQWTCLMRACCLWKDFLVSQTRFWKNINWTNLANARAVLKRSAGTPIDVYLETPSFDRMPSLFQHWENFTQLLQSEAHRLHSLKLDLSNSDHEMEAALSLLTFPLPNLQELTLDIVTDGTPTAFEFHPGVAFQH